MWITSLQKNLVLYALECCLTILDLFRKDSKNMRNKFIFFRNKFILFRNKRNTLPQQIEGSCAWFRKVPNFLFQPQNSLSFLNFLFSSLLSNISKNILKTNPFLSCPVSAFVQIFNPFILILRRYLHSTIFAPINEYLR